MFVITRVFANLPDNGWTELKEYDFIDNTPPIKWASQNNIEDYCFIEIVHNGINYKLHISNIQFM